MFDTAPETFNENIVECASPSIHTDGDFFLFQNADEGITGELRALIAVENLRFSMNTQGFFQAIHTKRRIHGITNPPTQHSSRIPVHNHRQISKTMCQPNVGDICPPHLIRPGHIDSPEKVGIHLVTRMRLAGIRPRCHSCKAHFSHQSLYFLAINVMICFFKKNHHLATAVERVTCVFFIN